MNLRRLLILLGLLGVVFLFTSNFGDPQKIIHALSQVQWYALPLVIITQLASYYCNAKYYDAFFRISGHKVPLRRLYETALGVNFANQAIPSGGVAGATYLAQAVDRYGVPSAKATLAQIMRYGFTFVSFIIVLAFGFLMLFLTGDLESVTVRLVILIMLIILTVGVVIITLFSERRRLEAFINPLVRLVNGVARRVFHRRGIDREKLGNFLTEFYKGYAELLQHKGKWLVLLRWCLGYNLTEVLTVYVVFVGFGQLDNPGVVITGYTMAILASIAGVLTNGFGVYEASMIGTFAALGVPLGLAFAVTIVYRVLNMGIFLPIGLHFYRRHLAEQKAEES